MKPIGIFRHFPTEGPGYFATYLERCGLPWRIIPIDAGACVPEDASQFSGIAFMGGPMSVNDSLPWIDPVLRLIRHSFDRDVPVIGHCLGGQLMAKALGAAVTCSAYKEIGWGEVAVAVRPEARRWFGPVGRFTTFHWHGETFAVPAGAVPVLSSTLCEHQAFVLDKHLALQCHVEMTAELVASWCRSGADEISASPGPGVQPPCEIERDMDRRLARLHRVADCLYARWVEGLVR
jgi:GMP synthase-like glutamine amidotransferase